MKKRILKKSLVISIMLLFILSIPSTGNLVEDVHSIGIKEITSMSLLMANQPVTTLSFDPPSPDGDNGWYVSNVTVTLNATDDSGVNATYYRINGGEWKTYEYPFVISEDGDNIIIEYYSVDNDGNIEDVKSSMLDIDQTPPEISFEWDVFEEGGIIYIKFSIKGFDATGGMNRVEFYIDRTEYAIVTGIGPIYEFEIQWSDILKTCTLKFVPYDSAGNVVIVKVESIKVFLFGRIENLTIVGDIFIFNAVRLRVVQFSPFSFNTYVSGEKIALLEPRLKIVTNRFVFGFFVILFGKVTVSYNKLTEIPMQIFEPSCRYFTLKGGEEIGKEK